MRGTRQYLAPQDPKAVLREIAEKLLAEEGQPVPDWAIVRQEIAAEVDEQADDLLAQASRDYNAFEAMRSRAARLYGRVDPIVAVLAGLVVAYLALFFAGPLFLTEAAANPGIGLSLLLLIPAAGIAIRWPFWRRRRRAVMRSVPVTYENWTDVLRNQVLLPFITEKRNVERRDPRLFYAVIGQNSPPRFVKASAPRRLVVTDTMTRLRDTARNVESGSLGVSGPRGVGKSTILQFFGTELSGTELSGTGVAADDGRDLRLVVSAPVDYESREFIIHLFTRLCEAVPADWPEIAADSRRYLEQLRYLRTFTTKWSASATPKPLPLPFPLSLPAFSRERSKERAEQPVTLPELVNSFRQFAGRVASRSARDGGRLVIGIDEVDKIRDSERAEAFLNDIKAVFGVPDSLYLVSLSEEAMASFARRTPSIRDSFDSAFDELVPVGPMTYRQSEELLFKRVTGVPRPFTALCHVLAGGLPRDLVRTARALIREAGSEADSGRSLEDMAGALIRLELDSLRQESLRQLADSDGPGELLAALDDPEWPGVTPSEFTAVARQIAESMRDTESAEVQQLCQELIVSLSFYATSQELFAPGQPRLINCLKRQDHTLIDDLAKARYNMRLNTGLAHRNLDAYRLRNGIGTRISHVAS